MRPNHNGSKQITHETAQRTRQRKRETKRVPERGHTSRQNILEAHSELLPCKLDGKNTTIQWRHRRPKVETLWPRRQR